MKIAVFGATGSVGRHIVPKLLKAGHIVTALSRKPGNLTAIDPDIGAVTGDVTDAEAVGRTIADQDLVLCLLGAPLNDRSRIRTRGTRAIVDAMQAHGVGRIVCLSSFGASESWSALPRFYRWVLGPLVLRHMLADHTGQEQIVRDSGIDWTIIRPVNLTDGAAQGYRHGLGADAPRKGLTYKVSRADLANLIAETIDPGGYSRQAVWLSS